MTCGGEQFGETLEGAVCQFPFKYKGETYNSCITIDHDQRWCRTDPSVMQEEDPPYYSWGNCQCDSSPELPEGKSFKNYSNLRLYDYPSYTKFAFVFRRASSKELELKEGSIIIPIFIL